MKVDQNTRASRVGKKIYCPSCNADLTVSHFSWVDMHCRRCRKLIPKHEWNLISIDRNSPSFKDLK